MDEVLVTAVVFELLINIYLLWRLDRLDSKLINFFEWRMWLANNFRGLVKEANKLNKEENIEKGV